MYGKIDGRLLKYRESGKEVLYSPRGIQLWKRGDCMAFSLFLDICTVTGAMVGIVSMIIGFISLVLYLADKAKKK